MEIRVKLLQQESSQIGNLDDFLEGIVIYIQFFVHNVHSCFLIQ